MLKVARHPVTLVAAVALVVASVSATPFVRGGDGFDAEDLLAYEASFVTHARDVGAVIEVGVADARGMKRAIAAIEAGELHGDQLRLEADVWEAALQRSATAFSDIAVPGGLDEAHELALRSFATYGELARALRETGEKSPADLDAALDHAVALGGQADDQFDAAAAVIQAARRDLGLAPNTALPDPERPLPEGVEIHDPDELYPEEF